MYFCEIMREKGTTTFT